MEAQLIPSDQLVNPKQGNPLVHFLVLPAQLLCLSMPPFPGRSLLLVPIITVLAYATYTNHPGDSVPNRAMSGIHWTVFIGTLEKLIFCQPERDFWRQKRGPEDALSLLPLSFVKLRWALSLCVNLRGFGWNFQSKGIPAAQYPQGKWGFLSSQLLKYVRCYIICDLLFLYFAKFHHEPGTPLHKMTLYSEDYMVFFINCFFVGCKLYFPLQMNYTFASILGVLLGVTEPKDWPPLFGDISKVTTVRYFWGSYWQQLLRRMFTGWGDGLARILHLPPKSKITTYFKLYVAFAISAFFHAAMTYTMPATKHHTFNDRFGLVFNGFMVQAFAVHAEDIVTWAWDKVFGRHLPQMVWRKVLGWVWVTWWMWFSVSWAAEGYLKTGITTTSDIPVEVVGRVLEILEEKSGVGL